MIERDVQKQIESHFDYEKAIIIKGARQVGKTTLIQALLSGKRNILWIDGDDPATRKMWSNITKKSIILFIEGFDFIVFDEAQRIQNIGISIKMILDLKLKKQIIISGSSSLNLTSTINEPLTGRKWTFNLFPLSWSEIVNDLGLMNAIQQLDQILILGTYPEVYTTKDHTIQRLNELSNSYLYMDILEYAKIRKPDLLIQLLEALAYQLGNEVSYNELSNMLNVDNETIQRYISLLEESYVIFRLPPLATNLRKEISTSRKIYFYDNGIRNAIINNFNPLDHRNDKGALWENYIISEMVKKNNYYSRQNKLYFWRSKSRSEIDLIVQSQQTFHAYEIKYNAKKKHRFNQAFIDRYNPIITKVINRDNFYHIL